jgi:hypothetical protein
VDSGKAKLKYILKWDTVDRGRHKGSEKKPLRQATMRLWKGKLKRTV